jgi:hypothetical protein
MTSGSPVEAVRRAFALLEELNRQRINSVQHLHKATALPKSTIVRLLETLRLLGYVANDPRQGGYQVTSGVRWWSRRLVLGRSNSPAGTSFRSALPCSIGTLWLCDSRQRGKVRCHHFTRPLT